MLTAYKSGAEQEAEIVTRYANGAEQEAEGVYAYKNGAEEEVWSAIKWMKQLGNTLKVAEADYAHASWHDYEIWSVFGMDKNDGGTVTYYLEGDFTNPTLSFEYDGFYNYMTSSGTDRYVSAGTIERYLRTKDGTESYYTIASSVNTVETDSQSYSSQLQGEFDRVGIRIDLASWSGGDSGSYLSYFIDFWNFRIDGKECLPSADCVIER